MIIFKINGERFLYIKHTSFIQSANTIVLHAVCVAHRQRIVAGFALALANQETTRNTTGGKKIRVSKE